MWGSLRVWGPWPMDPVPPTLGFLWRQAQESFRVGRGAQDPTIKAEVCRYESYRPQEVDLASWSFPSNSKRDLTMDGRRTSRPQK